MLILTAYVFFHSYHIVSIVSLFPYVAYHGVPDRLRIWWRSLLIIWIDTL